MKSRWRCLGKQDMFAGLDVLKLRNTWVNLDDACFKSGENE